MSGLLTSITEAAIPFAALVVDTVYGDPRSKWHPVVLIGNLISFYESHLYPEKKTSDGNMFLRGMLTVLLVLLTVGLLTAFLIYLGHLGGLWFYAAISTIVLYFTMTPRSLARDGLEIYHLLKDDKDLVTARKRLSWIVGRDTENLDESNIARGTIETIAENTTDGIISPLFYFLLFGPVGAMVYRAGNTMDSMLGYKNDRYLFFGRFAARLDDVLNYIPARITFLLFVAAAFLLHLDWRHAVEICLRDAKKHPSPNGGYAEATVAGAMHMQLGGYNYYEGKPEFREYMGDAETPLKSDHIMTSIMMMYGATILFIALETVLIYIFW